MPTVKLTQGFVDRLTTPPARDTFYWCEKAPGFGLKHSAKGAKTWCLQWRERITGRSHRLALGHAGLVTLADARKAAEHHAGKIAAGGNPIAERRAFKAAPTFAGLVTRYLKSEAWAKKAPSTQAGDARRIAIYLLPALGSRKLGEIALGDLKSLHATLCDPDAAEALARKGGALKACARGGEGGARRTMRLLKAIFGFAFELEIISDNPAARLKLGSDGARDTAPDDGDYSRLWAALAKHRGDSSSMALACDCFALIALTGARRGEIRGLRWRHVDLAGRRIVLPPREHKAGRKTGKARTIALPDEAVAILAALPGYGTAAAESFVFAGSSGQPVSLQRPWARIAKAAGLPASITLHTLRHGVGTALGAAGMQPQQIAQQLGHAQWRTSERYTHRVERAAAELAQITARLVRPPSPRLVAA